MAWILLNIHRATEAMGRAAVFLLCSHFASDSQDSSLSVAGILRPENVLAQSHNLRRGNENNN